MRLLDTQRCTEPRLRNHSNRYSVSSTACRVSENDLTCCLVVGKFAPQQETPSSSSSSSSRATSSSSSSSHATSVGTFTKGDRNPMGQVPSSKGFNRAPSKQTQGALASPQGRASDAARSGSNRDPDQAPGQGRLAKGRALARGPGSIAEDPEGQGRLPKGRTTEESPSGSSSFAGDALGPGANALQADAPSGDLMQCEGCGRSFNQRAFEVHSRICAKIFQVLPANPKGGRNHMCSSALLSLCPYLLHTSPLLP